MQKNTQPHSSWTYQRGGDPLGVEVSDWVGAQSPSLAPHIHDEPQVSIVYSGCRCFRIGVRSFDVAAGEMVLIPSGVPHASVGISKVETSSREIFINTEKISVDLGNDLLIGAIPKLMPNRNISAEEVIAEIMKDQLRRKPVFCPTSIPAEIIEAVKSSSEQISVIAKGTTLSREGFIRKFTREIGMTPLAYRLAHKVTLARSLLRSALAPATIAYETGFADQSHLGRAFRKNFGISPAKFQRVWLN